MTDQERRFYLNRLRFPPDLEREYQSHYSAISLPPLRIAQAIVLTVVLIICMIQLSAGMPIAQIAWIFLPVLFVVALQLAVTFQAETVRVWQNLIAGTYGLLSLRTLYAMAGWLGVDGSQPSVHAKLQAFILNVCVYMLAVYAISFVSARRMALLQTTIFSGAVVIAMVQINGSFQGARFVRELTLGPAFVHDLVFSFALVLFPMLIFLLHLGYSKEWYHRSDYLSNRLLDEEKAKSEALLLNILPEAIADRLKLNPECIAESFDDVSVLFADIVGFTPLSSRLNAEEIVRLLNRIFSAFDAIAEKHGLEKIKTIGDAYMVVGGLPEEHNSGHAEALAEMALDMQDAVAQIDREESEHLQIRIGINTGKVVAGVIGTKKFIYDLWGDTVNLASRMESHGMAGGIQVTETTYLRLKDGYDFGPATEVKVKGHGSVTAYQLLRRKRVEVRAVMTGARPEQVTARLSEL